jgi:hypothetical protein
MVICTVRSFLISGWCGLCQFVKKGEIIVANRYYGLEYGFFGELKQIGAPLDIRIRNNPRMEVIEELALTDADRFIRFP